jgi:hypothetical protein
MCKQCMNKSFSNTSSGGPLITKVCVLNTVIGPLQLSSDVKSTNRSINRYTYRYTMRLLFSTCIGLNLYRSVVYVKIEISHIEYEHYRLSKDHMDALL